MVLKSISIETEQELELKDYAEKTGLKEAEIFRQALDQYFESKTKDQ